MEETDLVNNILIWLGIVALEFVKGIIAAVITTGLTSFDASVLQFIILSSIIPALSVGMTGITQAIAYLNSKKGGVE